VPKVAAVALMLALTGLAGTAQVANPLPAKSNQVVDYRISVALDTQKKRLTGTERLTWRNPSDDTVPDLWFHLYLNAFRDRQSTFFVESGGQLRGDVMNPEKGGSIEVTSLKLANGADLTNAMTFEQPDDGNANDRTVMRVKLPAPVPPRGQVTLDIAFTAQLPEVFARTGYYRDYFLVGQWFPKIAVYEPAGRRGRQTGGWNCHQFHANSEFYADFGHFLVDITVPKSFVVGATGRRVGEQPVGAGQVTYTYEQEDVHDFAWTADPNFIPVTATFSAEKDVTAAEYEAVAGPLGRSLSEVKLSDVAITVLMQPGHMPQAERHIAAAKTTLKYFGLWYGRYPYQTLTVVDPAPGAGGSGGMEYPTFITAGTTWMANFPPLSSVLVPEIVTIHEAGHQWWYGLIANNEFEEAWLDEGINTYANGRVLAREHGIRTFGSLFGIALNDVTLARFLSPRTPGSARIRQFAWTYGNDRDYGAASYMRPQLVLNTLEGLLGEQTMARVMRTYAERWRFGHPSSDDFYAVASEISGRDLSGFFKQTVEGTGILDYELASLEEKPGAGDTVDAVVTVRRHGNIILPVELVVKFAGEPPVQLQWSGAETEHAFTVRGKGEVVSAHLDPQNRLALDVDRINNAKRVVPDHRVNLKWTSRWLFWLQNLYAFLVA